MTKKYCEFCYKEITFDDEWRCIKYCEPHCNEERFGVPEVVCA